MPHCLMHSQHSHMQHSHTQHCHSIVTHLMVTGAEFLLYGHPVLSFFFMRLVDVVRLAQYSPKDLRESIRILPQLCVQKYKRLPFKRPLQDGFTRASARVSTGVLWLWLSIVSHKNVVRPSQHCLRTCATEVSYRVSFSFQESHTRVTRVCCKGVFHKSLSKISCTGVSHRGVRVLQERRRE